MPDSLEAAILFSLLIAPGFLLVQSYRRGRSYSLPPRDLYVLAQAVVASVAWLGFMWFALQFFGDPLEQWGLVPWDRAVIAHHETRAAALLLGVVFTPVAVGAVSGYLMNRVQASSELQRVLSWTGIYESPTAWEHAWNEARSRAAARSSGSQYIDVTIRLKSGDSVRGRYGAVSRADLAPRASRHVYVETGFGLSDAEPDVQLRGDGTIGGVYIDGAEIAAVYFES